MGEYCIRTVQFGMHYGIANRTDAVKSDSVLTANKKILGYVQVKRYTKR